VSDGPSGWPDLDQRRPLLSSLAGFSSASSAAWLNRASGMIGGTQRSILYLISMLIISILVKRDANANIDLEKIW
jgi:hypothetical protein